MEMVQFDIERLAGWGKEMLWSICYEGLGLYVSTNVMLVRYCIQDEMQGILLLALR